MQTENKENFPVVLVKHSPIVSRNTIRTVYASKIHKRLIKVVASLLEEEKIEKPIPKIECPRFQSSMTVEELLIHLLFIACMFIAFLSS